MSREMRICVRSHRFSLFGAVASALLTVIAVCAARYDFAFCSAGVCSSLVYLLVDAYRQQRERAAEFHRLAQDIASGIRRLVG